MRLGLSWTSHRLVLCRARRRRDRIEIAWAVSTPLPAGSLVPSFTAPNIQDLGECEEALATTAAQVRVTRGPVAVTLPDPSLRVRLLPEEPQGGTRQERKQLIAWQLRDTLPFPPEQARVDYLPLSPNGSGVSARAGEITTESHGVHLVTSPILCLIASAAVVSQYEAILRKRRLIPIQIGPSSLALWNLWETSSGRRRPDGEDRGSLCALFAEETYTTLLAFAEGAPRFWRCLVGFEKNIATVAREVGDSLHTLTEEGTLPPPLRVLVHATPPHGGELTEILRRELDLAAEEMEWQGSLPREPAVLSALGAALSV